jgi:hypothetical protein
MLAYILYIHFLTRVCPYIHTYIQEEEGGGRYRNRSQDRCREIGPRAERKERGCQSREGRGANTYIHSYIHAYIYAYIHTQYLVYPDIIHTYMPTFLFNRDAYTYMHTCRYIMHSLIHIHSYILYIHTYT